MYQLMQTIQWLQQRVAALEMQNEQLKEEMKQIKPVQIESIVYKIQELQIKDLKGTLNIGITAQADEQTIDKFMEDFELKNEATITFDGEEPNEM